MPQPDLEALTSTLFAAADERLGDTVTITPPAHAPVTLKVNASHRDNRESFGVSAANIQDALIDCDMAALPSKPDATYRVSLPLIPGKTYAPRDVQRDASGRRWEFGLKEVQGA